MKRKLIGILVAVFIVISGLALQTTLTDPPLPFSEIETLVGHSINELDLTQGENGEKTWRVQARRGTMQQADGRIRLDSPQITYYQPDAQAVYITAKEGEVLQQEDTVRLWGDVHGEYEDSVLTSESMLYSTVTRIVRFTEGATLSGRNMVGQFPELEWHAADNMLYGSGGVQVVYTEPQKQ